MDVETTSFNGDLNKEVAFEHVMCPEGLNLGHEECPEMRKGMCGSVQTGRVNCWKCLTSPEVAMKHSTADQCFFVKQ